MSDEQVIRGLLQRIQELERRLERSAVLESPMIANSTPASAGAAGVKGEIRWDASYIYICTATNTWKRAAISSW